MIRRIAIRAYWIAIGAWMTVAAGAGVAARAENRGAMDLALPFAVAWTVGGLFIFLLANIFIRKFLPRPTVVTAEAMWQAGQITYLEYQRILEE